MKNKMLYIIIIILVLFAGLYFVVNYKNNQAMDGKENPYGKDKLNQLTIDILDDPLYQNIITPDDLDEKIANGDPVTVYFFSPDCIHCQKTTPVLVPLAEEMDVDMKKMNLLEFDEREHYKIEGTPTLIHYENGEEIGRIVGEHPEDDFEMFFNTYVKN